MSLYIAVGIAAWAVLSLLLILGLCRCAADGNKKS